ncbi:hypothetical protein Tco_0927951 [Tanacetum coccineum]
MLCKPKSFYDEKNKVAIGYKNPLCLTRAKQAQSALYNGHVLVTTNHTPTVIHDSEDTREIAEITRKRMLLKMQSPLCVENKVRIAPPDYSKENLLATFAPQRNLTPEQIFWSIDENDRKKAETSVPKPLSALTVTLKLLHCLSNQLLYDVEKSRCLDLEAEMSKVHNESKHISKLEREYLNLQLKYQHLQESFDNKKSQASQEAPDFNSFFKIKNLENQIQEKDNVIRDLKVLVSNVNDRNCEPYNANDVTDLLEQNERLRAEIEKVKQHYKEMFESIKITRSSTNEKTSSLLTQIEDLKAQLEGNLKVAARSSVKTKVLAPGMYAIDVEPIPPRLKNNRSAHLNYISHLKESVETVREIVEEARVVKPLDSSLNYACRYTKLSQELLECVIGTCPKSFNERDNKAPSTPVTWKKQVTFNDKPGTSSSNTQKHKVHQKVQQTNVPVIHSTGVNTSTRACGSQPRSNTKQNRILPAKSMNNKKVEDNPRTNKSVWTKVNRVDSSISSKRVVINSNSESVCKTCNECLNSASHEMCVVNISNSVNATSTVKIVLNKGKQTWKPKGKLSDNSLNKTKQIWKPKGKLSDNSLKKTKQVWKATGKLFANVGYQWRPTGKKSSLGKLCPLTRTHSLFKNTCRESFKAPRTFVEKFIRIVRFGNETLLELSKGYGDYVIGDSVISRVYNVEGLGHNLFSVGQFCDFDLKIAFRKHSCFVRDMNGVDLLKGLLRKALDITPVDANSPIFDCTSDRTRDKPRHPVLQMLWGIVTKTNIDHAELLWEEFTQGIQTFFSHKASHKASLKDPKKKAVPLLIPYGRFTKMIIYYVGSTSNFIPKGETDEVFGMAIPKPLITEAIQQSSYYPKYLEMVAKNTKKTPQDSASKQSVHGTKHAPPKKLTPVKPTKPAPVKQTKPPSSKLPKSPKKKPSKITPSRKVRKGKPSLVDEEDEAQQELEPQGEGDDPALELAKKLSLDAHQEKGEAPLEDSTVNMLLRKYKRLPDIEGKGKAIVIEEQAAHLLIDLSKKKSTTDQFILQRRDQAPHDSTTRPFSQPQDDTSEKVVHESSSTTDSERTESETEATTPKVDKEQGEVASTTVCPPSPPFSIFPPHSGVGISVHTENQAGSDPGQGHEALAGSNLEPMQEDSGPGRITVNAPPINIKATEIITTLPEITPFIALQLRVTKIEQDMSEVQKTDHSTAVLAFIQSQVPTVVEKIKREQGEKKPEPMYTIKSTDKVALEEFDLKGALFNIMHKNKSANRNLTNYRLYHALMEALIKDENAMDKEVADKVKDHKRKRDSDDDEDDDDEGPLAGSNQGESTKKRRHESSTFGSSQPPSKDSKQSTKNKLGSNTSAAQQPPAHTSSA